MVATRSKANLPDETQPARPVPVYCRVGQSQIGTNAGQGLFPTARMNHAGELITADPIELRTKYSNDPQEISRLVDSALAAATPDVRAQFTHIHDFVPPGEVSSNATKWQTNAFGFDVEGQEMMGVALSLTKLNHSCQPNAKVRWDESKNRLELLALKRIETWDEITICYLAEAEDPDATYEERRKMLHEKYGFICQCRKCEHESRLG